MKNFVYTIEDRIAAEAGPLFTAKNDQVALRQFKALISNSEGVQPDEYRLLKIAQFNTETIKMITFDTPEEVILSVNTEVANV